jgi:molybdopterin-containing oxidoreductase family membrane subunit
VFGNVLGLLTQTRLPSSRWYKYYDPRCSGEHFGVLAACEADQEDGLKNFFQKQGAEVKVFEQKESPLL